MSFIKKYILEQFTKHRLSKEEAKVLLTELAILYQQQQNSRLHPLVERMVSCSEEEDIFESVFNAAAHWVLSEHKINGSCVMPGTVYLEMARVAAHRSQGWAQLELRNVLFLVPMTFTENESRRVRIQLRKTAAQLEFDIASIAETEEGQWIRHVEGRIRPYSNPAPEKLDIDALTVRAQEAIGHRRGEHHAGVFEFGPHWDAIDATWCIGNDVLTCLSLPSTLQHELAIFALHPSMLDNAVNLIGWNTGSVVGPFAYRSFRVFGSFTAQMYSLIKPARNTGSEDTLSYDVILAGKDGAVLGEVTGYVVKKGDGSISAAPAVSKEAGAGGEYLSTRWVEQIKEAPERLAGGHFLLIGRDVQYTHAGLIESFKKENIELIPVSLTNGRSVNMETGLSLPADEGALSEFVVSKIMQGVDGIIFSVDAGVDGADYLNSVAEFAAYRRRSVDALFHVFKTLLNAKIQLTWGLCILTRQAYRVDGKETYIDPLGAAATTLGATIRAECKHLRCRFVDTDGKPDVLGLTHAILAAPAGQQTALRAGSSFARELFPHRLQECGSAKIRENGVYLITGGLSKLSLATAAYLAKKNRVKIVLTGRFPIAPHSEWARLAQQDDAAIAGKYAALLALSKKLVALDYIPCDISHIAAVDTMLQRVRDEHGLLKGIFHLGGIASDGFLQRKDVERFDAVLKPKLDGLRHLYAATADDPLDYFVLFSSSTALAGGEGRCDYAAANAFMDALAWQGAMAGRPLCAIDWPGWEETGIVEDGNMANMNSGEMREMLFMPLAMEQVFSRLDRILAHVSAHGLVQVLPSTIHPVAPASLRDKLSFLLAPELQLRLAVNGGKFMK